MFYFEDELKTIDHQNILAQAAERHGIPDKLPILKQILRVESGGKVNARSPKGASGLMQLVPKTARGLGVQNIFDPYENIDAGVRYYKQQLDTFGDDALALAAYNAGPGAVKKFGNKIPPYKETQKYVKTIMGNCKDADNCGDYVALAINPLLPGKKLPRGGLGEGQILEVAKYYGAPILRKNDISLESLQLLGPGTVIRMTRRPGDKYYNIGDTHAEMIAVDPESGQLAVESFTKGKGRVFKPLTQNYIDSLPQQVIATNFMGQNIPRNMVADVSGRTMPPNIQPQTFPEKERTISKILGDAASFIAPTDAQAAEPEKKSAVQYIFEEDQPQIKYEIEQPELTTGQQIARTVAPYTKHIIPGLTMGVAGVAAAPAAAATYGAAEIPALSFGAYVGNDIQNRIERYAGLQESPNTAGEYINDMAKNAWRSINEGTAAAVIGGGLNKALGFISEHLAPRLYKIAMKPSTTIKPTKSDQIIETGLEEGVAIGRRGLKYVAKELDQVGKEIMAMADEATAKGHIFPYNKAVSRLNDLIKDYQNSPIPSEYIDKIKAYMTNTLKERGIIMTPSQAQQMKMDLYKMLPDKIWGEAFPELVKNVRRTLSRGLKEELEMIMPEVAAYNKRYGKLAEFNRVLERAVNRVENREILNMYDLAVGGTAGGASGDVKIGAISAIITRILRDPTISSYIATAMKRAAFMNFKNIPSNVAGHAVGEKVANKIFDIIGKMESKQLEPSFQP